MSGEIPKSEETKNYTVSHSISTDLEIWGDIEGLSILSFLGDDCSLSRFFNNGYLLECSRYTFITKTKNFTIFCERYENDEWDCKKISESSTSDIDIACIYDIFLNYILSNFNYTIIRNWEDEVDGRLAYCYSMFYSNRKGYNITGSATLCIDKQTKFLIMLELEIKIFETEIEVIKKITNMFYCKYEVKNLVINPEYEDYLNMLNLSNKTKVYIKKLYVPVYNNSLSISMDVIDNFGILEKIEEIVLYNLNDSYRIENCVKREDYIICSINETIEEFIRKYKPLIKINTQKYIISPYKAEYVSEKMGRLIKIEGSSKDVFLRGLIVCYDKDWNVYNSTCQGYKYWWEGDYIGYAISPFSDIILINDTVKKIVIVVNSPESYPWTINVYERNRLVKTCYNVTARSPCTVYFS